MPRWEEPLPKQTGERNREARRTECWLLRNYQGHDISEQFGPRGEEERGEHRD
jgi:hypothetical protein